MEPREGGGVWSREGGEGERRGERGGAGRGGKRGRPVLFGPVG